MDLTMVIRAFTLIAASRRSSAEETFFGLGISCSCKTQGFRHKRTIPQKNLGSRECQHTLFSMERYDEIIFSMLAVSDFFHM